MENNSNAPDWLREFADTACEFVQGIPDLPPMACHFHETEEGIWECSIFAARTEVIGGPDDGLTVVTPLDVDLFEIHAIFDEFEGFGWQSGRCDDDDEIGAHIRAAGLVNGHRVELRILAEPPETFGCGRLFDWNESKVVDLW